MAETLDRLTLTVDETAHITGKTSKAIRLLISRGIFPHRKLGRSIVILREDVDRFLAELPGVTLEKALALNSKQSPPTNGKQVV